MSVSLVILLSVGCLLLLIAESRGLRTTLQLKMKGDIKRESAFLAQWGQSVATPLACLLIWQLDNHDWRRAVNTLIAVSLTSVSCFVVKRLSGRVRPNREQAGKFLGPSWKHANWRESFVSSHSACAVALSAMLANMYPQAAATWWSLAIVCAGLRYVLDAHWPSDVLGGVLLGYVIAHFTIHVAAEVART